MTLTQENRPFQVFTPLPFDTLLLSRMSGEEDLGRLFRYDLELLSVQDDLEVNALLGHSMSVRVVRSDSSQAKVDRYFHGAVRRFSLVGYQGRLAKYHAELRPWFWFLTRTADCRIFQDLSVPEIAKQIFQEHGYTDFDDLTTEKYPTREYCVQYRETDFDFLSRLFEHEGIYYYFVHEEKRHLLILSDASICHHSCHLAAELPYYTSGSVGKTPFNEYLDEWILDRTLCPGRFEHRAFDFTKPRANLSARALIKRGHGNDHHEIFDYPEWTQTFTETDFYSKVRMEELQSEHIVGRGETNSRSIASGCLFRLTGFPRQDQNREYLVKSTSYLLQNTPYETGALSEWEETFQVSFAAVNSDEPFRPARTTQKAVAGGPQTAMVVGKDGEEIWTDKYGRVKVQFHWDRYGKKDENSSCWIRVSQPWAGKGWGGVTIPRIGQEVIVDFLEGDPDQPIITGRVYNGATMPPYKLPAQAVVSGMKSQTHKGAGYNEIAMVDTAGAELLRVNAQYDATTTVGHDRTETVNHDQSVTVVNNRTDRVGVDAVETIGTNLSQSVGANKRENVGANKSESVGANKSITVGANQTESVAIASAESVGAVKALSVGAGYQITVGAAMNTSVALVHAEQVGLIKHVLAGSRIVLECGSSKIAMDSGGKITITGTELLFEGSGPVKINGSVVDIN